MIHTTKDVPKIIRDFLVYMETIRGKSKKTADEYFLDLRVFFRYMLYARGLVPDEIEFDQIPIDTVDVDFIKSITLSDIYDYMNYLGRDRVIVRNRSIVGCGLGAAARARKTSSLRTFFKYLTTKAKLLDYDPLLELEHPKLKKTLPRHLTVDESVRLLSHVDGPNAERDYCILTLFLNCGLRVSELVSANIGDISDRTLKVTGKGNKERIVYLNDACIDALERYDSVRKSLPIPKNERALFISRNHQRISVSTVKWLVKKHLAEAGLDPEKYSAHKLRHTAATLMYQNGVDVRTLQTVLGHESLNTTRIYTHVSDEQVKNAIEQNPLAGIKAPAPSPSERRSEDPEAEEQEAENGK
ncbi:MAG: tyrosine recombinase XerC [Clostridia bacterium]|nr:tyrosine recombinase XerC [Clostridia bacterium]